MNIYISSLSFDVNDRDLEELFEGYGAVTSAKVITDRYTGRSRGFGFVEMPENEEANNAINELNGTEFKGRTINVNEAKPKTDSPRKDFGGGNKRGGYNSNQRSNRW